MNYKIFVDLWWIFSIFCAWTPAVSKSHYISYMYAFISSSIIVFFLIDLMHWRHVSITTTPCWGSRLVALRARVVLAERIGAQPLSQCAGRARASPAVWHAGVGPLAACLAMAHVAVTATFDPQRGWAPFCDVICIRSIEKSILTELYQTIQTH